MTITRTKADVVDQFQYSLASSQPLPEQIAVLERWVIHWLPFSPLSNPAGLILLHVWKRIQQESREDLKALLYQQTRIHRTWSYLFIDVWTSSLGYAHTTYPFDMPQHCPAFLELTEVTALLNDISPTLILDLNASWPAIKRLASTTGRVGFQAFYRYFTSPVPEGFHPITSKALSEEDSCVVQFIRDEQLISEEALYQLFFRDTEQSFNWAFILNELSSYYLLHAIFSLSLLSGTDAWKLKNLIDYAKNKDFQQITNDQWGVLKEIFHENTSDVQKGLVVQFVLNDENDILIQLQSLPLFLDPQAQYELAEQIFHHLSKEEFNTTAITWLAKWDPKKISLYENACVAPIIAYIQRAVNIYLKNCDDPAISFSREMTPLTLTSTELSLTEYIASLIKTPQIATLLVEHFLSGSRLEQATPILFNLIQESRYLSQAFAPHYNHLHHFPPIQIAIAIEDLNPDQQLDQLREHPFRLISRKTLTN